MAICKKWNYQELKLKEERFAPHKLDDIDPRVDAK